MDGGSLYMFHLARRQGQWSLKDDRRSSEKLQVNVQIVSHNGGLCTLYCPPRSTVLLEQSEKRRERMLRSRFTSHVLLKSSVSPLKISLAVVVWHLLLCLSYMSRDARTLHLWHLTVCVAHLWFPCLMAGLSCPLWVCMSAAMNRCGRSKPQFLARLPSSDLFQWLETQVGNSQGTRDKLSGTKSVGAIDMRVQDRLPTVVAAGVTCVESSEGRADRKKRSDMPVVRKASKGDAAKVRKVAMDPKLRAMAQSELEDDMHLQLRHPEKLDWRRGTSFIAGGLAILSRCCHLRLTKSAKCQRSSKLVDTSRTRITLALRKINTSLKDRVVRPTLEDYAELHKVCPSWFGWTYQIWTVWLASGDWIPWCTSWTIGPGWTN